MENVFFITILKILKENIHTKMIYKQINFTEKKNFESIKHLVLLQGNFDQELVRFFLLCNSIFCWIVTQ